jgi:di/tricarboxylate transporter
MDTAVAMRDAAKEVITEDAQRWWHYQAVWYTYGWVVFMTAQGTVSEIPNLWAYIILGAIVPIAYAQNLFCAALLLDASSRHTWHHTAWHAPNVLILCLPAAALQLGLMASSSQLLLSENKRLQFRVPLHFGVRFLVFLPYLVLQPRTCPHPIRHKHDRNGMFQHDDFGYFLVSALIAACNMGLAMVTYTPRDPHNRSRLISLLRQSRAMSAPALSYAVGVASLYLFLCNGWGAYSRTSTGSFLH